MSTDGAVAFKKQLLKKDKVELVKILKSKKQPTNGGKSELVDRILGFDEKHGNKMAKTSAAEVEEQAMVDAQDEEKGEGEGEEEVTPKKKPKRKKSEPRDNGNKGSSGNGGGGGGGGGGAPQCDCSGGSLDCAGGIVGIAQFATALAAIGQLVMGIIQFILLMESLNSKYGLCPDADGCLGGSMLWEINGLDETSSSLNVAWRTVFTLQPSFFFENWTPQLFALIAMMQLFSSTQWHFISGSWLRCMLFHLVMILFAALPYCGKAGIIIGFVQVFTGFMCLLMCFVDRGGSETYVTYNH